jgi:hypothetical protein
MRDSHLLRSDVKAEPGRQQVVIDTAGIRRTQQMIIDTAG